MNNFNSKLIILRLLIVVVIHSLLFITSPQKVFAQDFRSDYQVEYFLSESQGKLDTKVRFTITITNFKTEVYVRQFSLGFPKSFTIRDIKAFDDNVAILPKVTSTDSLTKISLEFSDPKIGKGAVNNFYLEFYQDNLFTVNGNVWEVIIPTVESNVGDNYKIIVHLPLNSQKKISISKPKPDSISGNVITWNNPSTKTVYAVFGDTQYYKTELTYRIKNTKLIPVYTDIAFPPDTLYQKIFLDKINPEPASVATDPDGNYLGRYYLNPGEGKTIIFQGTVGVYSTLREDMIRHERDNFSKQKNYLLAESKYWQLSKTDTIANIASNPKDIYDFVTNKLEYDYDKVNSANVRLGADGALNKPDNAVCMEFTDLFIAISRRKGIYAREIEGYGFSQDPKLRPLSLVSDILHTWPEYYDSESNFWLPVDPTWENTSGIDYFSSFDLNHIAFVIHGKDPEYPQPAGTYKVEDSRDVSITAVDKIPQERKKLSIEHGQFPTQINDTQTYQAKITVKNEGNTYFLSDSLPVRSTNIEINPKSVNFSRLAPFEEKSITLSFKAKEKNKRTTARFSVEFPKDVLASDAQVVEAEFTIIPYYYELAVKISLGLLVVCGSVFLLTLYKKRRSKISAN